MFTQKNNKLAEQRGEDGGRRMEKTRLFLECQCQTQGKVPRVEAEEIFYSEIY